MKKRKKGIFQEVQKIKISLKKGFKKLINRKMMKDVFFFSKNTKQQKFRRLILGKIKHVVVLQKKSQFILFERTRFFFFKKKKTIRKRDETKKEIEQTKFYK